MIVILNENVYEVSNIVTHNKRMDFDLSLHNRRLNPRVLFMTEEQTEAAKVLLGIHVREGVIDMDEIIEQVSSQMEPF